MGGYGSMVTTGTMIAASGYQAISFASEAIHLVIQKIRERDLKVKRADVEVKIEKFNWTEILSQKDGAIYRNGTPGEDQEIRFKNSIIRRMNSKKYKRPTSLGTRRGYSLRINYGAEVKLTFKIIQEINPNDLETHNWTYGR